MTPRIGSLCSGYEGLGAAVMQVYGGSLAWVSDNDKVVRNLAVVDEAKDDEPEASLFAEAVP